MSVHLSVLDLSEGEGPLKGKSTLNTSDHDQVPKLIYDDVQ